MSDLPSEMMLRVQAIQESKRKYLEEGKFTKWEMELISNIRGRGDMYGAWSAILSGIGGYRLIKRRLPGFGGAARWFGTFGCVCLGAVAGLTFGHASAEVELTRLGELDPSKKQVYDAMDAEIKRRVRELKYGLAPQQQGQQSQRPVIKTSYQQGKSDGDVGSDRNLPAVERAGAVESEPNPQPRNPPEEHRPAEPSAIITETKSSWDKVRSEAENSVESQYPKMKFPEKRRRAEQQVDSRSQEQKEFEALVEKERQGDDN